eukprot:scaffold2296_cov88-Phaeocystis_antarctica.AAC.2
MEPHRAKIAFAAIEHACGVQATAGEGHRRSLCSPDAPLAGVDWGGSGQCTSKICANFFLGPKGRRRA